MALISASFSIPPTPLSSVSCFAKSRSFGIGNFLSSFNSFGPLPLTTCLLGSIFLIKTKMAKATKAKSKTARKIEFVKKVIRELEQIHSDAKLDLDFTNPLELLIALILAAQARDDLVNQVTVELFKK